MTFLGPAALVAGLWAVGSAGLLALYLLRLRRRRVQVPFAPLWKRVLIERETTSLFRKFKRWWSWLIQVALLGLLLWAIANPRVGSILQGRNVALVIDSSASMKAADIAPSRMARAKQEARAVVRGLSGADSVLLIRMDAAPRPIGSWTDSATAIRLIDQLEANDTTANLDGALSLAADALRGRAGATLILTGDGAWPEANSADTRLAGIDIRYVPVGSAGDNLALTKLAGRRRLSDRRRFDLFVEAQSFRDKATDATLELFANGTLVERLAVTLGPHEKLQRSYPDFGAGGGEFRARIHTAKGTDWLAIDDELTTVVPQRRRRSVLLVTDGNLFLEGALLADPDIDLTRATPQALPAANGPKTFDAIVLDRVVPAQLPAAKGVFYVEPPVAPDLPLSPARRPLKDPILTEIAAHPLTRGVALRDVNIRAATSFVPLATDTVLASSFGAPVLLAGERSNVRHVVVGFDVRQSDLPLRAAFPLFLANALDWFVGDEEDSVALRVGETARIQLDADARAGIGSGVAARLPSGATVQIPVVDGRALLWPADLGMYEVAGRKFPARLAGVAESQIMPRKQVTLGTRNLAAPTASSISFQRNIWVYLALLAALVACVEWFTYHRRVTV